MRFIKDGREAKTMLEKDIENLIARYPEEFFPDEGFKLEGQQVNLGRFYADIIFRDKYNRKVVVEVKRGSLSRKAAGQVIDYYGILKTQNSQEIIELILCANIIPAERRVFLENAGIECKEIGEAKIKEVAEKYGYKFAGEDIREAETNESINTKNKRRHTSSIYINNYETATVLNKEMARKSLENLIKYLKAVIKRPRLEGRSCGYRMIERYFSDFQQGKEKIEIDAKAFSYHGKDYFGTATKRALIGVSDVFGYKVEFIFSHYGSHGREYNKKAIFTKIKR